MTVVTSILLSRHFLQCSCQATCLPAIWGVLIANADSWASHETDGVRMALSGVLRPMMRLQISGCSGLGGTMCVSLVP